MSEAATPGNIMKIKTKGPTSDVMMKRSEKGHEKGRGWRIFQHI